MTYRMQSYDYWDNYLKGGRKKYMRPLYEYGMVIEKANKFQAPGGDFNIYAKWAHSFPFIVVHNDDSFTLQSDTINSFWGGSFDIFKSQGIRYRMWKYTGITVFQKNFKVRVIEGDPQLTPSKIQRCRGCKGSGLMDGWCNSHRCYQGEFYNAGGLSVYACSNHPDADEPSSSYSKAHATVCEHGQTQSHEVPRSHQCWGCNGAGKRDYGNKPVSLLWDGSPLRVKDRKIVSATMPSLQPMSELERMLQTND